MDFGTVITAIATVVSVVVANKLTFGGSREEKIWDLRRQAYGVILSELASVERLCFHEDEFIAEDAERFFASDHYNALNGQIAEHMATARQRFSDDYLIVSDAFITKFASLLDALSADDPNGSPPEAHERFTAVIKQHRPRLMAQARSELPIRKITGWHRILRWTSE